MKNNHNFLDLQTYFEKKMNLKNLSIDELQYHRDFSLNILFKTYLLDLFDCNFFGFQVKKQKKSFWEYFFKKKKKNNKINIFWKEFDFWKYFYFPTFNYTLVYAKDLFTYKNGNVTFTTLENKIRKRRFDSKEWKNKYLVSGWWNENDDKLYIEENDKFSYLPDDVIKNNFVKVEKKDFVFTRVLPFGSINFLKTNNVFLSVKIFIFQNNEKIVLNMYFYYFFKANSYLFEHTAGCGLGSFRFDKWSFDLSWMIIPENLKIQANYVKVFFQLEKQINLLIKIKKKTRNLLHFLGKNCLDDKSYKLKDLVQRRKHHTYSSREYFDYLRYPRAKHLKHIVFPYRTVSDGYQWEKVKQNGELPYTFDCKKICYDNFLHDIVISKIFAKIYNPYLVDCINYYAISSNTPTFFSKKKEISNQVIFWSILGQKFYTKYGNKWKRGTGQQYIIWEKIFNEELMIIKPKYYRLTNHLSNIYNFCAKNVKKYTKLRKDIATFLQDPATIDFETREKYLLDLILEADQSLFE